MTHQDINIKYSDLILSKYQFNGRFTHQDLKDEKIIKLTDSEKQFYTNIGFEWYPTLTGFMLANGYVYDNENEHYYTLTERGNLCKELNGHKNYIDHRTAEIKLLRNQGKVNNCLIFATLAAAFMPFISEFYFKEKVPINISPAPVTVLPAPVDTLLLKNLIDEKLEYKKSNHKALPK